MTRAERILELFNAGAKVATAGGLASAAMGIGRAKQAKDDKVRAAGLGNKLDNARAKRKSAAVRHAINPLSKKRKSAYMDANKKVKSIKKRGHKKYTAMQQGLSDTVKKEMDKTS